MKFFKSLFVLVLALCMMVSLCACGGEGDTSEETTNNDVAETTNNEVEETTAAEDDRITYKVTVVDEENNPVVGAMVQLCLEACIPALTNNNGVAIFKAEEADYKVSFVKMPDGYTCDTEAFYFAEGSYELTITLKAA